MTCNSMKHSFLPLAIGLLLVSCKSDQTPATSSIYPDQEPISLVFLPDSGEFKIFQDVSTETEAVTMKMTTRMNAEQALRFIPASDGAEVVVKMERIRMEMQSPLDALAGGGVYNSDYPDSTSGTLLTAKDMFTPLLQVPISHRVDQHGKVSAAADADSLSDKVQKVMGNAFHSQSALWVTVLPEKPVKPGDQWEETQIIPSEMGDIQTVTTFTLLRYTADSAFVQMTSTGHLPKPQGAFAQAKIRFQETGELVIIRPFGYVGRSTRNSEVEVILTMMGMDMTTRVKSNIAFRMER